MYRIDVCFSMKILNIEQITSGSVQESIASGGPWERSYAKQVIGILYLFACSSQDVAAQYSQLIEQSFQAIVLGFGVTFIVKIFSSSNLFVSFWFLIRQLFFLINR